MGNDYDDGLNDGRELMKWVAKTVLTNRMKKHSHGSKAYVALKDAREAIMNSDDKVIVCVPPKDKPLEG